MSAICLKVRHLTPEDFSEFGWAGKPEEILPKIGGYMFPTGNSSGYVPVSVALIGDGFTKYSGGEANESDWQNTEHGDSVVLVAARRIARENKVQLGELHGVWFDRSGPELVFVFWCS